MENKTLSELQAEIDGATKEARDKLSIQFLGYIACPHLKFRLKQEYDYCTLLEKNVDCLGDCEDCLEPERLVPDDDEHDGMNPDGNFN